MFTLTKILALFVYPLSLGVLLIGLSLLGQLRGNRAAAGLYTFLALAVLYYPSTEFGVEALAKPLEARYPAFAPEELPDGDVIVVLGGGIDAEGAYGRWGDMNQASDRVISAAELWQAKKAKKIIVSGGSTQGPVSEARRMADVLSRLSIPSTALRLEEKSINTEGNAREGAALVSPAENHILLVTSSMHMRRASALFAAQGFRVTAAPTDHRVHGHPDTVPGWMPRVKHLDTSTAAIHEWVAYWVSKQLGRFDPVVRDEAESAT
mgnify:CR=1 FL=1